MFDLHLHSTASDGEYEPQDVVVEAKKRGIAGLSLTDHNGLWGVDEAANAAQQLGLKYIEGIEITSRFQGVDVHILGYSQEFDRAVLEQGLAGTRQGYADRIQEMLSRCQQAGYAKVTWEAVRARRADMENPCYVSFDVACEIAKEYGLDLESARRLTVSGGVCQVPYGNWALAPVAAVGLIHEAGGVASLAHPGTIESESSREILLTLLDDLSAGQLDAVEIVHPFHGQDYQVWLTALADQRDLFVTGGSDWHGSDHLPGNHAAFGKLGVSAFPFRVY